MPDRNPLSEALRRELEKQVDEETEKPALEIDTRKLAELLQALYGPMTEEQQARIDRIWERLVKLLDEREDSPGKG